jgi:uncharacterized phage infection (PIP) family protein YhgE
MIPANPASMARAAVFGVWLLALPDSATASGAPLPPLPTTVSQTPGNDTSKNGSAPELAALKKQLDETNSRIAQMQQQLQQLSELLRGRSGSAETPATPGLLEEIRQLRNKLADVEAELNKLRSQYSALSPARPTTPSSPSTSPLAGKGLVRLVNDFSSEVTLVLNGVTYRIPPRQSVDVSIPAGEFSYQLLEAGGTLVRKPIREQELVILRIH